MNTPVHEKLNVVIETPIITTFSVRPTISQDKGYTSTYKDVPTQPTSFSRRQLSSAAPEETIAYTFEGDVQLRGIPANQTKDKWFFLQLAKRSNQATWKSLSTGIESSITPGTPDAGYADYVLDGTIVYGQPNGSGLVPYKVNGGQQARTDTPTIEVIDKKPNTDSYLVDFGVDFDAQLFVMYLPEGSDSIPVPIAQRNWKWDARQRSPWPVSGSASEDEKSHLYPPETARRYAIQQWTKVALPS